MALSISREIIPLKVDKAGSVLVGGTRVTLETVISAFKEGATAEEIMQQYPSLKLADIYFAIGYYLRRREEVEAYLSQRAEQAIQVKKLYASPVDLQELRERLIARHGSENK